MEVQRVFFTISTGLVPSRASETSKWVAGSSLQQDRLLMWCPIEGQPFATIHMQRGPTNASDSLAVLCAKQSETPKESVVSCLRE
jgi:hypothetical protein